MQICLMLMQRPNVNIIGTCIFHKVVKIILNSNQVIDTIQILISSCFNQRAESHSGRKASPAFKYASIQYVVKFLEYSSVVKGFTGSV